MRQSGGIPPDELHPPEMERDPLGERLPNPFATGDLEGQTILAKRNPRFQPWIIFPFHSPLRGLEWKMENPLFVWNSNLENRWKIIE
jgi:hypothetical protein